MFRNRFASASSRLVRTNRLRRRSRRQPTFEAMEKRLVLSTLIVNPSNPADYSQIGAAVNAASPGDLIEVYTGTYNPFTVPTNDLTIEAANAQQTPVIDATGSTDGVVLSASGVTIEGLTVQDASTDGFLVTGSGNTLSDNIATSNGSFTPPYTYAGSGFDLQSASNNVLHGNTAMGNEEIGINVSGGNQNTLIGNTATGNGSEGFELSGADSVVVSNNISSDEVSVGGDTPAGFSVDSCNNVVLTSNTSQGDGLGYAVFSNSVTLNSNSASGATVVGFYLDGSDLTLVRNTASGRTYDGFEISLAANVMLQGNLASNNGQSGFELVGSADCTLQGNRSTGNVAAGFRIDAYALVFNSFFYDIQPSSDNVLQANTATANGGDGLQLMGTTGNTLMANSAKNNGGNGFSVESQNVYYFFSGALFETLASDDNTLEANSADSNAGNGFYCEALLSNVFTDNYANNNGLGDFDL